jgi:hypothetical protein
MGFSTMRTSDRITAFGEGFVAPGINLQLCRDFQPCGWADEAKSTHFRLQPVTTSYFGTQNLEC